MNTLCCASWVSKLSAIRSVRSTEASPKSISSPAPAMRELIVNLDFLDFTAEFVIVHKPPAARLLDTNTNFPLALILRDFFPRPRPTERDSPTAGVDWSCCVSCPVVDGVIDEMAAGASRELSASEISVISVSPGLSLT